MTLSERKSKSKRLLNIVGNYVEILLKTITRIESFGEDINVSSNLLQGYLVDVDESYVYVGEELGSYVAMIDLNEIGMITIKEDIPEELLTIIPGDDSVH